MEKIIISRKRLEELEQMEYRLTEERRKFKESAKYSIKIQYVGIFGNKVTIHTNEELIEEINGEKENATRILNNLCEKVRSIDKLPLFKRILIAWNARLSNLLLDSK